MKQRLPLFTSDPSEREWEHVPVEKDTSSKTQKGSHKMITTEPRLTPAKRKRLLKSFGPPPAGYTTKDLEQLLDLLYGMYSHTCTLAELRQIVISDPFDRSETPRQLKLVEFIDWLEAIVS